MESELFNSHSVQYPIRDLGDGFYQITNIEETRCFGYICFMYDKWNFQPTADYKYDAKDLLYIVDFMNKLKPLITSGK